MAVRRAGAVVRSLNLRTAARTVDFTVRLRNLRFAVVLILLSADFVLATYVSPPQSRAGRLWQRMDTRIS